MEQLLQRTTAWVTAAAVTSTVPATVLLPLPATAAIEEKANNNKKKNDGFRMIEGTGFSVSVPSEWNIIKNNNDGKQRKNDSSSSSDAGLLLSVLDLKSGTAVTVVRERVCPPKRYFEQPTLCDLPMPPSFLFSEETLVKDAQKLLVRHDDRDNRALGAYPSILESAVILGNDATNKARKNAQGGQQQKQITTNNIVDIAATTEIPTGGTTKDAIGRTVLQTLTRRVQARAVVENRVSSSTPEGSADATTIIETTTTTLLSVWVSTPVDEWTNPASGTKIRRVVDSIQLN